MVQRGGELVGVAHEAVAAGGVGAGAGPGSVVAEDDVEGARGEAVGAGSDGAEYRGDEGGDVGVVVEEVEVVLGGVDGAGDGVGGELGGGVWVVEGAD